MKHRRCKRDTCPECSPIGVQQVLPIVDSRDKQCRVPGEDSTTVNSPETLVTPEAICDPPDMETTELISNWLHGLDLGRVQLMQESDPCISKVLQYVENNTKPDKNTLLQSSEEVRALCGQRSHLRMEDGKLYRLWTAKETSLEVFQLIAPSQLRKEVFDLVHGARTGGHLGVKST